MIKYKSMSGIRTDGLSDWPHNHNKKGSPTPETYYC